MRYLTTLLLFAAATAHASDLRLLYERQSLTATWRTYRQVIDGLDVIGTDVVQRVDRDGSVHEEHRNLARPAATPRRMIAAADAVAKLPGKITSQTMVALNVNGEARPAWRMVVEEQPLEPVATYVDASTGEVLRREPLYWNAKARVFDPNPVAKLNDPSLADQNNSAAAVPPAAYSDVDLDNLAPSGMLTGPNVTIVDTELPFTTLHADASQPLIFDRSQPQFEEVNAYYHLDRAQKYLQSLGYTGPRRIVAYSIAVDPHAANGTDNSYYISHATDGSGALFFGDGGTDDAEDSDIMLHEYGHAIQDWIAPGVFSGTSSSQSRAMGEGFGDYWSFSSNYDGTVASGRDPYCIADWDARCGGDDGSQNCGYALGADCLRRVDSSKTMANYYLSDLPGTEHMNGEIWSSALREIFMSAGRRTTDTLVLEATFGVPPNPTFAAVAERMLNADRALYGGAHADAICKAMTARLILSGTDCNPMPRGDETSVQGAQHGVAIPASDPNGITATAFVADSRTIDKLLVRVDIAHPSRGDLHIVLIAPDGTSVNLQQPTLDRVPDVHATFGLDTQSSDPLSVFNGKSEPGTWKLVVASTRATAGTLISWDLRIRFTGDQPLSVRPFSFADRLHIPAVAHTDGIAGSQWRSDVVLFNRGFSPANVTLLFTPTGANGATDFGAVKSVIQPQQVVDFRDVVASLFNGTGGGTIEIQGDVAQLLAWSSTYDASEGGTIGQTIDAVHSSDAIGANDPPLDLVPASATNGGRTNVGVVETAGESGTVLITAAAQQQQVDVPPFTHIQLPVSAAPFAEVKVTGGLARVIAYASAIDGASHDPLFVPARRPLAMSAVVPVVASTPGANATHWTTDLWAIDVNGAAPVAATFFNAAGARQAILGNGYLADALATTFGASGSGGLSLAIPDGVLVTTRVASNGRGDRVDAIPVAQAIGAGDAADAIRIENDAAFRTNVGATEVDGAPATVRFALFDAAGNLIAQTDRDLAPHQQMQMSLSSFAPSIVDGRVHFEVVGGSGRVIGYASVVDNSSNDASFVRAQ